MVYDFYYVLPLVERIVCEVESVFLWKAVCRFNAFECFIVKAHAQKIAKYFWKLYGKHAENWRVTHGISPIVLHSIPICLFEIFGIFG